MQIPECFDHLVIAVPDLAENVEQCERILGVRPVPGGSHPGLGTANALLGLDVDGDGDGDSARGGDGPRPVYLEFIGPDPEQDPALAADRLAGITEPTVQRWAIRPVDFDAVVTAAATAPGPRVDLGAVADMTRRTPDGEVLEWRLTRRMPLALGGIQPFLIDWKDTPHPSSRAMPRVGLTDFRARTPRVAETLRTLDRLDATIDVEAGDVESLHATLKGPGGSWTI
ncbi:glyoxalase-like protein [Brevibacterium sanguinis]|uniref:Glyoxalase-like protein n=2 Tax=Brevibacterium TaxID=1696 RepID=A0A366IGX0_9MICO|nr:MULTISPECIES: VOC family protein [Brevibacterium]RBP63452.1 glyoxalase-like protein [Brevibacterium sanguinis]RBP69919.1 glyoxalase-like protein [Brevibacterium celere]